MRINNVCWLISARVCVLSYVLDEPCRSILYKLTHTHTNMHTISALPEDATIYNQLCNCISKNAASCARMKITTSGSLRALFCAPSRARKNVLIYSVLKVAAAFTRMRSRLHVRGTTASTTSGRTNQQHHQQTTPSATAAAAAAAARVLVTRSNATHSHTLSTKLCRFDNTHAHTLWRISRKQVCVCKCCVRKRQAVRHTDWICCDLRRITNVRPTYIHARAYIFEWNSIGINDARALTHIYRDYYFFCVAPVPAAVATSDTMRLLSRLLYTVPMLSVTRLLFLLFPISVPSRCHKGAREAIIIFGFVEDKFPICFAFDVGVGVGVRMLITGLEECMLRGVCMVGSAQRSVTTELINTLAR